MRPSNFARFDRHSPYREPPARRRAVILSSLFLLSLSAVAAFTTVQARQSGQDEARMTLVAMSPNTAH